MSSITRGVLRWGLIGGLALGGLSLMFPNHVRAALGAVRGKVQHVADSICDDPAALRRQVQSLAEQYPDRIAEVQGELAQVERELDRVDRDIQICRGVVAMTTDDLGELKSLVTRAETEQASTARPVSIRFEGARFDVGEAYHEAARINKIRLNYQDRLASNQTQFAMLTEQKTRLDEILAKLESEYSTFQTQLWQLDRQIDAIERNERLIDMTEQLQATLDSYSKWGEVGSMKQLEARLAEMRTIQEAQLKALKDRNAHINYEDRATLELDGRNQTDPFEDVFDGIDAPADDDADNQNTSNRTNGSVAWLDPIVIE